MRMLAAVVVLAACSAGLSTTGAAGATGELTSNWAGYALTPIDGVSAFTNVAARWVQPPARCTAGSPTSSAFWVGLGGFTETSQALEQIGTEADCSAAGKPSYSMWYELLPAPSVPIKWKVFPGNVIAAAVTVDATDVHLLIRNLTRRTRFERTVTVPAPDVSSAEWIAEAPSVCRTPTHCVPLPLTNFGTVSFTRAMVTGGGETGTIANPAWAATALEQIGAVGRGAAMTGALPSPLAADGASFSVGWEAAPPLA
jgi:Peptidase A4 family